MQKLQSVPLILLLCSISSLTYGMNLDFNDLESLIQNKNKKVAATTLELNGVEKRLGYLKRSFLPTGEAWVGKERFDTGTTSTMTEPMYSLRANLNLYKGGRDALEETSRKAQKVSMEVQSEQVLQNELFEARELFWSLVYLREINSLYQITLKQNEINLSRAIKRINSGLTTNVDRLEFEISETQLQQDMARITVAISTTQRRISAVLGLDPETQFETIGAVPHDHNDATPNQTMDFNFFRDVRMELAKKNDFEAQGISLKRWWAPRFDLYAESMLFNYRERSYSTQSHQMDHALGARLSFYFDGFQQQNDGESLIAKSMASQLRADQIKIEAEAAFNTARQELSLLHDLIHDGERSVEKGAEYLRQTQSEYARGVKNSPDVLSAMLKQLEFKKRFAELRRDYAIAKAQLQSLMAKDL